MEVKKTDKAGMKGANTLYFLIGLNVVLGLVLGLFYLQKSVELEPKEEAPEVVEVTEAVIIDIPEPDIPPPPPPPDTPPPPPPPEIPMEIEETPDPVEPPPLQEQEIKTPDVPTGPVSTGPVKKVDLSGLNKKAEAAPKEERSDEPLTVNRVHTMAVYPGCEKEKRKGKRALIGCFSKELSKDVLRFLDQEYPEGAEDKPMVAVQLKFHVDKNGTITNVVPARGDDTFKPEAKRALEKASDWLKRKGKLIDPATMKDGSKATLIFQTKVALKNPDY